MKIPSQINASVCIDGSLLVGLLWWLDLVLQRGPLMVIFHHGDAAEDKGEEVRGGAIH